MKNTQFRIEKDLRKLGVENGDCILIHSSLRSLGVFENRAETLLRALLNAVGNDGTLAMPSLSYEQITKEDPFFDVKETASCVGGFTNFFRKQPGVIRSLHPTHSVCAIGKHAEKLTSQHHLDRTPCGEYSPFQILKQLQGKILFVGTGLKPNTSMHGIEELSRPEYLLGDEVEYTLRDTNGVETKKTYITHNFKGWEQRYDRVPDVLNTSDYSIGKIREADAYLIEASPLWDKAHARIKQVPLYFVDKKDETPEL